MKWKNLRWLGWVCPFVAVLAVFVGYSLFPLPALTPELSREVAVTAGLRPAEGIFPGHWRYLASMLPPTSAVFGFVGRALAAVFSLLFFLTLRKTMLMLNRIAVGRQLLRTVIIPVIALVCAVMGTFSEPVWRAFSQFTPAALTLLFAMAVSFLYLEWIEKGGWWRLCGDIFLMGVFVSETPLGIVFPVAAVFIYGMLWKAICGRGFVPRPDLPTFGMLPKWRMFLSFVAGVLVGGYVNVNFIAVNDVAGTLGWKFTYVVFHYWQEYLALIKSASMLAGWILGVPLCVIPFLVSVRLVPLLTDDDRPLPFALGVSALACGLIAYFEQGPLRGAWFWTWIGDRDLVSSASLLGFFSALSTSACAFIALIFVADAFNPGRSEARERGVVISYRLAVVALTMVVSALILVRLPHVNVRRVMSFNDWAVKETYRELNGARFVFTDGSADAELELEAWRHGERVYAINLMADDTKGAEALRLRGLPSEGDVIAAKMGASALLRVWACDKPNGLDNVALQVGLVFWKREKQMTPPVASAFVARTCGLREEDVRDASAIARAFADQIVVLTSVADAVDVPPSVRKLFFTVSWRLSRFARYRKEQDLANRLDSVNTALKQMLRDFEYARMQVFLQMTPKEGLELALRRAEFQDAARYAAAVLKLDEDDPHGNFGMGMYFLMGNRYKDAEPYLRRVLVRRPDEPATLNNLSIICRKLRRYDEAIALAKRALEILPDSDEVKQTLKDAENKVP